MRRKRLRQSRARLCTHNMAPASLTRIFHGLCFVLACSYVLVLSLLPSSLRLCLTLADASSSVLLAVGVVFTADSQHHCSSDNRNTCQREREQTQLQLQPCAHSSRSREMRRGQGREQSTVDSSSSS